MVEPAYKRVLITGGAGFIGSHIAHYLADRGYDVTVMDNLVRRGAELNIPDFRKRGIRFFHGDIRCTEDFDQLHQEVDLLIECSAQPSVVSGYGNPRFDFSNNLTGTLECLEFCRIRGAGMLFFSSNRVYSADRLNALPIKETDTRFDYDSKNEFGIQGFDPHYGISSEFSLGGGHKSIYGVSKVAADLLCQEWATAFDMPIVINRCGVISGEGQFGRVDQGWVVWWALAGRLGIPLQYIGYRGKQVRDILFIEDLCRLVEMEIRQLEGLSGQVFNVGGGRDISLSLREATALVERLLNSKMDLTEVEDPRKDDIKLYLTDNRRVKESLGWKPEISLTEGYERIVRWVHDHGETLKRLYL